MPVINCYIPIKVTIKGIASDSQLDELGETLVKALVARLEFAERTFANEIVSGSFNTDIVVAETPYEPVRSDSETNSYRVPSYEDFGADVSVQMYHGMSRSIEVAQLKYVCVFVGYDLYGTQARSFAKSVMSGHTLIEATTMEEAIIRIRDHASQFLVTCALESL